MSGRRGGARGILLTRAVHVCPRRADASVKGLREEVARLARTIEGEREEGRRRVAEVEVRG